MRMKVDTARYGGDFPKLRKIEDIIMQRLWNAVRETSERHEADVWMLEKDKFRE